MFRESLVDSSLNRLSSHFGSRLVVHPPATADVLAELEHLAGLVPREFVIFLSACNGLRVHADGSDTELHLWGSPEVLAASVSCDGPIVPEALLPIRGDPTGERDWLVCGKAGCRGAVVRWDPWVPGAALVASGFGVYLAAWVGYVISRYDGNGCALPDQRRIVFDGGHVGSQDPGLSTLANDRQIREWLQHFVCAVACGDDFE
jgi:hypothetical protein